MGGNPEEMGIGIDPDGPFDSIHQFYFFRVRVIIAEEMSSMVMVFGASNNSL